MDRAAFFSSQIGHGPDKSTRRLSPFPLISPLFSSLVPLSKSPATSNLSQPVVFVTSRTLFCPRRQKQYQFRTEKSQIEGELLFLIERYELRLCRSSKKRFCVGFLYDSIRGGVDPRRFFGRSRRRANFHFRRRRR